MKIVHDKPPIYERARAVFKFSPHAGILFAWGDTIYATNGAGVSGDLMAHESIHELQQEVAGGPAIWWDRYLVDPEWRLEQEIEAYGAQVRYMRVMQYNKKKFSQILDKITFDLSGPMYGSIIGYAEAQRQIQEASMQDIRKKYNRF